MTKEIFALFSGEYSDWQCHGYFTTYEEAERVAVALSNKSYDGYTYWIDNYYVLPLSCLDETEGTYDGKLVYNYRVQWNRKCSKRDIDYLDFDNYYTEIKVISEYDKDVIPYQKEVTESLQTDNDVDKHPFWSDTLAAQWSSNKYLSEDDRLKIARDMVFEWRAANQGIN